MGWLMKRGYTRSMIIDHLTQTEESEKTRYRTIAHCLRGNVLWSVVEITSKVDGLRLVNTRLATGQSKHFIACHLLARSEYGWGYKDMEESMHPYYYTCPIKYLEMVPVVECKEWREKVYEYHGKPPHQASLKIRDITLQDAFSASFNQLSLI